MIIIFYQVYWLIFYLLRFVCYFSFNYCSKYVCCCLPSFDFVVLLWPNQYIIFSSLIDCFLISLDLYAVSFHFNFCSAIVNGYFTRNDLFTCLWNDHFFLHSAYWLIDSWLILISLLLLFKWSLCMVTNWSLSSIQVTE